MITETTKQIIRQLYFFASYKAWNSNVGDKKALEITEDFHNGVYGDKQGFFVQVNKAVEEIESNFESQTLTDDILLKKGFKKQGSYFINDNYRQIEIIFKGDCYNVESLDLVIFKLKNENDLDALLHLLKN